MQNPVNDAQDIAALSGTSVEVVTNLDTGTGARIPGYEAALKANNKKYELFIYEGAQHGFHNDTTPRYDEKAAKLAWDRTLAFFNKNLR